MDKSQEELPAIDMSNWVAEKADHTLQKACKMVDWFRKANLDISRDKKDEIVQALFATIYDSAKLVGYAHENLQAWSRDWVELMFSQGTARYDEYMQRVNQLVPNETPPAKYPLFVQDVFENFEQLAKSLSEESNKTLIRQTVLTSGKKLKTLNDEKLRSLGDKLLDLVDEQSVHARISWEEFVSEVKFTLEYAKEQLEKFAGEQLQSWA